MTPVQILWTEPFKRNDKKIESCLHMFLSAKMLKEIYGEVHVITDEYGKNLIQRLQLPYDKIYLGLDHASSDLSFPDAKVIAYKMLSDLLPGFLYFDHDVFITKPVAKHDIIVQCDEGANAHPYCIYHHLLSKGVKFCLEYKQKDLRFFNMGLFRCVDKNIIYDYYETYFTERYQNKYADINDAMIMDYTMFLEQNCIYKVLQKHNQLDNIYEHYPRTKEPYNDLFFNSDSSSSDIFGKFYNSDISYEEYYIPPSDINNIDKTGYTHLMHYKVQENVLTDVIAYAFKRYPKELSRLMINMKHIC